MLRRQEGLASVNLRKGKHRDKSSAAGPTRAAMSTRACPLSPGRAPSRTAGARWRCRTGGASGLPELRGARSPAALADQGDRTGLPGASHCGHARGQVGNRGTKRSGNLPRSPCWQVLEPRSKVGVERGGRLWGPRSRPHALPRATWGLDTGLPTP